MEAQIETSFPDARVTLIESRGGVFEVTCDGELIYSKKATGRHAEWPEVRDAIARRRG